MLLITAAHVVVDALLALAVVATFVAAPVVALLLALPFAYVAAFTAALVDATMVVAAHDDATEGTIRLARAWSVAWQHRKPLAAWAFDLLTIGLAIRLVAALFGRFGRVIGWGAEVAWAIVALLVVPAIVVGEVPMPAAFDVSRQSLRQTFGDRVRGVGGLNLIGVLVVAPLVAFVVVAALADVGSLIVVSLGCLVAAGLAYAFVLDAATAVLGYSIYAHTAGAPLPPGFTEAQMFADAAGTP